MSYTIERLGHLGDGIARGDDARPIFAQRVLPGEVVTGDLTGDRLDNVKVVTPSEDRVAPPCRHFKSCGGCALQHGSDGFVSAWKESVVETALSAQGLSTAIRPIHTSPPRSRRRAGLAARRTKKGAMIGFHTRGSGNLVEVPDCQLLHPDILAFVPALEALTVLAASRTSVLTLHVTQADAGLDVDVEGGKPIDGPLQIALANWCQAPGLARLSWEGEVVVEMRAPAQVFGLAQVSPPPGAFLQATRDGEAALVAAVSEILTARKSVVDLFSGAGTFALSLADKAEVLAVENSGAMLKTLDRGWREAKGVKRVDTLERDLFRRPLMPDELARFDGVVLDPPRAGAEAQVRELAQARRPVVAMVSCNPVTFARDARVLVDAGYRLDWVQPVDQFRWSAHIELVGAFTLS